MDEDDLPDLALWRRRTTPLPEPKATEDLPRGCIAEKAHDCIPQVCTGLIHNDPNDYGPTYYPERKATKSLSQNTILPALGLNPHQAQAGLHERWPPRPHQRQFPVWYFFCDEALSDPAQFAGYMKLKAEPVMFKASVYGAYRALEGDSEGLVDGPSDAAVAGSAFVVHSERLEERIRLFAGCSFEVVRCVIRFAGSGSVGGLTLRRIEDMVFMRDEY